MYIGTPVCTSSALQWSSRAVDTHCFDRCQEVKKVIGRMSLRPESYREGAFQKSRFHWVLIDEQFFKTILHWTFNNHLPRTIRSLHFSRAVIRHLIITVEERAANTEQTSTEEATHLLKLSSSHMITLWEKKATPPLTWHTTARLISYFIRLKKRFLTSKSLVLILSMKWPEKVTNSSYWKYSYVLRDDVLDYSTLFQLLRLTLNGRSLPEP